MLNFQEHIVWDKGKHPKTYLDQIYSNCVEKNYAEYNEDLILSLLPSQKAFGLRVFEAIYDDGCTVHEVNMLKNEVKGWYNRIIDLGLNSLLYEQVNVNWIQFCKEIRKNAKEVLRFYRDSESESVVQFKHKKKLVNMLKSKEGIFEEIYTILGSGSFSVVKKLTLLNCARKSFLLEKSSHYTKVVCKDMEDIGAHAVLLDESLFGILVHQLINQRNNDLIACKVLGLGKTIVPEKHAGKRGLISHLQNCYDKGSRDSSNNLVKVNVYMELLKDFDRTLRHNARDHPINIPHIAEYCKMSIYMLIMDFCNMYETCGIVHADVKVDNIMMRSIDPYLQFSVYDSKISRRDGQYNFKSFCGQHVKTFTLNERLDCLLNLPTIIDFDCSVICDI